MKSVSPGQTPNELHRFTGTPSHPLLWAVRCSGEVFHVTATGKITESSLPKGWHAEEVTVAAQGRTWVMARNECHARWGVWLRVAGGASWKLVIELEQHAAIAAARSGVWVLAGHRLDLIGDDGRILQSNGLEFDAVGVCEGPDESLWLLGGLARLGESRFGDEAQGRRVGTRCQNPSRRHKLLAHRTDARGRSTREETFGDFTRTAPVTSPSAVNRQTAATA